MTRPIIDTEAADALGARISARIDTGIGAARYDGDEGSSASTSSHPERQALKADDLSRKRERDWREADRISADAIRHLADLQAAVATITTLSQTYPSITAGQLKIPGITPCPHGKCHDCWNAGIERTATKKRYADHCRRCGDYRKRNGYPIPPEAIKALAACDGNWHHWSVQRALRAS